MTKNDWLEEFPNSIIVSNPEGVILEMNGVAAKDYEKLGGKGLIGSNMLDCHPEPARSKLVEMLKNRQSNIYITEKADVKKLIYQAPWTRNGEYAGFVELSLVLPEEMQHFVRG